MNNAIVVGTDGSDTAQEALRRAADLARAFGVPLHVVSAYRATTPGLVTAVSAEAGLVFQDTDWLIDLRTDVEERLERTRQQLTSDGIKVDVHALPGNPVDAILQVAAELDADMIVVGNKGMKGARRVLGSVPNTVAHKAECSVLIAQTC